MFLMNTISVSSVCSTVTSCWRRRPSDYSMCRETSTRLWPASRRTPSWDLLELVNIWLHYYLLYDYEYSQCGFIITAFLILFNVVVEVQHILFKVLDYIRYSKECELLFSTTLYIYILVTIREAVLISLQVWNANWRIHRPHWGRRFVYLYLKEYES